MNVSKIIEKALKKLGVLAAGEKASAEEVADALDDLNALLAQWATHRLFVHKAEIITIPLQPGKHFYQVGKIQGDCCEYEITCSNEYCCEDHHCDEREHYSLARPDVQAEIAYISDFACLDGRDVTMLRDLNNKSNAQVVYSVDHPNWKFWVKGCGKELKIKAYVIAKKLCVHDELHLPDHYERALISALAVEIAPMFGVEPSQTLYSNHSQAMHLLKRTNSTPMYSKNDLPVGIRHGFH